MKEGKKMYNVIDFKDFSPEEILEYLRKSRSDDPALSVEEVLLKHEGILDEWAVKNLGEKIPEENKFREVVSGETIADRPEVQEVLKLIESPKYKAILVVEIQRLSRGDLEDAGRLIKLLRYTNTMVITPQKVYDLRDEYDRDMFERELKRGNEFLEYQKKIMMRGRVQSVKRGNFIGSVAPYGYEKVFVMDGKEKCPTLKPIPEEARVVQMIFEMYVNEDLGRVTIAKRLNELGIKSKKGTLWKQDAIKDLLENEHYIGKVRWNWRKTVTVVEDGEVKKTRPATKVGEYLVYEGKHEAIISEELFRQAREKQGRNHRAKPTTKVRNPLVGLLFCQCGRAMSLRTYKKDGIERCAPRLLCDNQAYCGTSSSTYDEIIDRVRQILKDCIQDFEIRIQNDDKNSEKLHANLIKQLKAKMIELEKKELAQWEAQSDPNPENRMPQHIFKALNEKLLREKEEVQQALCKAYESMPEPVDYEERLHRFKDALEALDNPDVPPVKKNRLLKSCINKITYSRGKAERVKGKGALPNGVHSSEGRWTSTPIELEVELRV